ncbi:MAG: hypothetical protein ACRC5H_07855 [Treponemataceae bacterium]
MQISVFLDEKLISTLPVLLKAHSDAEILQSSTCIADAFGQLQTFEKLVDDSSADAPTYETKQLSSFYNNLNLLLQKTWVEKHDEDLKEQLYVYLDTYKEEFGRQKYENSYTIFLKILEDVGFLMFGSQSSQEDFLDYALRIDPVFGIFWWYCKNLPESHDWPAKKTRIILLLGMIFIANY